MSSKLQILYVLLIGFVLAASSSASAQPAADTPPRSYYPHWVTREGSVPPSILKALPDSAIIGAHHEWSLSTLRRILDFPGKQFQISWYVESNIRESDDPTPVGTTVAARISEAVRKQSNLLAQYDAGRFANLFELNGSRDKKDGNLRGRGNRPADWVADAAAVKAAGFRLIAKSPAPQHVDELRRRFGHDFVARIVFEDVTAGPNAANPGYRRDARQLSRRGEIVTLIVHSGAYGGFPGTPLSRAKSIVTSDFAAGRTEAFWGQATAAAGIRHVKQFAASAR